MKPCRRFALQLCFFMLLFVAFFLGSSTAYAGDLETAVGNGDLAAVKAALDAGADANAEDPPPLYFAVRKGSVEIAKLLIDRGANVNATGSYWGPILYVAVNQDRGDLVRLLLARGANPNAARAMDSESALHVAAGRGCLPCVKALVEAGANVNAVTTGDWAKTPIHLAKLFNNNEVADYLMAHGVILPRPDSILSRLAAADPGRGKTLFSKRYCIDCHDATPAALKRRAPPLWNVVGRSKAGLPGQSYSKALQAWGGTWTYDDLNRWLSGPAVTTPGVFMEIAGVRDETERADLIAYLRLLSDKPVSLP